jgi:hypothetical protein
MNQLKQEAGSRRSAARSTAEVRFGSVVHIAEALDMVVSLIVDMDLAVRAVRRSAARKRQRKMKGKVSRVKSLLNQMNQQRVKNRRSGGRGTDAVRSGGDFFQGLGLGVVLVPGNCKLIHW